MKRGNRYHKSGFTLVETLVTIAVVATLAAAAMGAIRSFRQKAETANDLSRMRNIGMAVFAWAADHHGSLPRSSHSAIGHGELGWQREILPHLGYPDTGRDSLADAKLSHYAIHPADTPPRSPALNVYFELNPEYDDYEGAPRTWRRFHQLPNPSATALIVSAPGLLDHVMAHFFVDAVANLPAPAPGTKVSAVVWADGRTTLEAPGSLYDPERGIDRFHPDNAR